jgi:serine/threonine protein kinase
MPKPMSVSIGQCSDKGIKPINQDFHGAPVPEGALLQSKGIAIALADGISSSSVSQEASATSVQSFLSDYYCTSEAWSVKTSGQRVLEATNSWLNAQARRNLRAYDPNKGYVCTFSAVVIKSRTAHIFHVGDSRIYRVQDNDLEQLTRDHRFYASENQSYLTRAMGMDAQLEIDYHSLAVEPGDTFILATDGIYEFVSDRFITAAISEHADNLDKAALAILNKAREHDSDDNLTIQILRVDHLQEQNKEELHRQMTELPFPPELSPRDEFDGYNILRKIHSSPRSHVFLAQDKESGITVILKVPSGELRDDTAYLERFLLEEWIARRLDNDHIVRPSPIERSRNYLYITSEYIEGQTLSQWMRDNPKPSLEQVRNIIEQVAKGLQAFHRLEMLHQDIKSDNIIIAKDGVVKLIDFGSVKIAGIAEIDTPIERLTLLGTAQYSAPEYFLGQEGSTESDIYALGVVTYEMLSGKLPYGMDVARLRNKKALNRLHYKSIRDSGRTIPMWADEAIRKAIHPVRSHRYREPAEFIYELRHPNAKYLLNTRPPILERDPVMVWQGVSLILAVIVVVLLFEKLG